MVSILDTLFGVSLSTDKKDGKQKTEAKNGFEKASPIPAAMGHGTWRFHTIRRWRVFTSVATTRTNSAAAIPGQKFSPSLQDIES